MKRRRQAWLYLALFLTLSGQRAWAERPIYAKLTIPLFFDLEISPDVEQVNEEVNRITREEIGAEVRLIPVLYFSGLNTDLRRQAELELLSKEGIAFDLVNDALPACPLRPLEDLMAAYGQDILPVVGEKWLAFYRQADGHIYKLPSVSDYVASEGISMRRDILDKYGLDAGEIRSLSDLDALFSRLHALEPDLKLICGYRTGQAVFNRAIQARLVYGTVFCPAKNDPTELVNYYASEEYREIIGYARKWYEAGYMPGDMALANLTASNLVQAGELFAYSSAYKPGIDYESSLSCATQMVAVPLMKPQITPSSLALRYWGIAEGCANPGKAMQFLNLLYRDARLVNLLLYGIEGTHYQALEDGTIDYPQGVTRDTVGYLNTMPWLLPNQLIAHVWSGNDPELWSQTRAYNQSAAPSQVLGFSFVPKSVKEENDRLNEIVGRYAYGLGSGQLDPQVYLPQMLEEMEKAGLRAVQSQIQSQFDIWLSKRSG